MTEDDNWDEDLEEDAAIARVFQHLSIYFYYLFPFKHSLMCL